MCVSVCVHACVCVRMHVRACVCVCVCVCLHVCMCVFSLSSPFSLSLSQLGGVLVEGIETSLHGSGQLDYELTQSNDSKPTLSNQHIPMEALQSNATPPKTITQPAAPKSEPSEVGGASSRTGVLRSKAMSEVEVLKNDMSSVWSMSREMKYGSTAKQGHDSKASSVDDSHTLQEMVVEESLTPPKTHFTNITPSHMHVSGGGQESCSHDDKSPSPTPQYNLDHHSSHSYPHLSHHHPSLPHSPQPCMQPTADGKTQDGTGDTQHTHTITPPHHHSPTPPPSQPVPNVKSPTETNSSVAMATTPVAMETETVVVNVNPQADQLASSSIIAMTTEEPTIPWFSLTPRSPCETKPTVAMATIPNGIGEGQFQLVATTQGGQQILASQQQVLQAPGLMQYYITPSGALAAAAPTQQVQMGYALVGNTLVPQQYLTTSAPQQQYIVSQGGVQYLVGGTGGLMGLGGLGGVAVVPQGGMGQHGLVQAIGGGSEGGAIVQAIGDGGAVMQAIGGGAAVVIDGTTAAYATSDGVEGVKTAAVDDSRTAALVHVATEDASTNQVTDVGQGSHRQSPVNSHIHHSPSRQKTVVMDTSIAMDTAAAGVAIETRQETVAETSSTEPTSSDTAVKKGKTLLLYEGGDHDFSAPSGVGVAQMDKDGTAEEEGRKQEYITAVLPGQGVLEWSHSHVGSSLLSMFPFPCFILSFHISHSRCFFPHLPFSYKMSMPHSHVPFLHNFMSSFPHTSCSQAASPSMSVCLQIQGSSQASIPTLCSSKLTVPRR